MKRITIKDIAREFGIHHSTVSRALRGSSEINAETREAIIQYASKMGYQINRNALHLRGAGSNIIGVIVPNIHHSFFSNFVSTITRLAFAKGYIVSVFQSEESLEQEKEIIESIIQQNIAGVIASLSMESQDASHFSQLEQYGIPLVGFDRINPSLKISSVVLDNESALKEAVLQMHGKGFSKMAYLSGMSSIHLFQERQKGYYAGLKLINSKYEKCINMVDGFSIEQGFESTEKLFRECERPDALIFDSHILAWGGLSYLRTQKNDLLDTIGIASFGGYPWMSLTVPNILFIQQPEEKMAEASFDLITEAILNPSTKTTKSKMFKAKLFNT